MLAVGSFSFSFSFRSFYSVASADPLEEGMSFQLSLFADAKRRLFIWVPTVAGACAATQDRYAFLLHGTCADLQDGRHHISVGQR